MAAARNAAHCAGLGDGLGDGLGEGLGEGLGALACVRVPAGSLPGGRFVMD
jgi:hypothetical protein